ncbi:hypothetical protein M5D96_005931 [Drosophila gunungcola]|uniref:Peptidase S1 domain-containing protein n=1 Tax=Drosophila gunungcola TaxID=103775 RepID=A0A9P9YRB6_9MUSC|nr:hypothetical protein M5D96_005931 [Drosophila gunungcola]
MSTNRMAHLLGWGLVIFLLVWEPTPADSYALGHSKFGRIEKFPYQVMLIGKQLWRKRILCGWHTSVEETQQSGGLVLRSNKFIVHERFSPETAANDIALVKLPQDIGFTSRIQPASLPSRFRQDQFAGMSVVASGWGAMVEMTNSDSMQYTELKVISNAECAQEYDVVSAGVLCAKGLQDETVCTGDSGGPLVLKDTQMVVGITSFGPADGCETNIPGGFTRVTYYLDWIESKIGGHGQPAHRQYLRPQQHHYSDNNLI